MSIVTQALQAALGFTFLTLGAGKVAGAAPLRAAFARLRLPGWLRLAVGGVEALLGLAMLGSVAQPILAFPVALLLALVAAGALALHLVLGPRQGWPIPAALLVAALAVAILQPLALRIMALPAARALPLDLAPAAEVLARFPPGVWLESLAIAPDGAIFLAANRGMDLLTGDLRSAQGEVIRRAPDGAEEVVLTLSEGSVAGGMALDGAGVLYLATLGKVPGLWRIAGDGPKRLADLPPDAWPNGVALGPDGQLYLADSRLGRIWRVDPATGAVSVALEDPLLLPRPFIALAPGANGLAFRGDDLIVTVSDRALVLRFPATGTGFGPAETLATGIPGDGLAVDRDGALLITTHPYDTVVRLARDGGESTFATAAEHIAGASDAAFGTLPDGQRALFVVTDGGAFAGKADAEGLLVTLRLE